MLDQDKSVAHVLGTASVLSLSSERWAVGPNTSSSASGTARLLMVKIMMVGLILGV